MGGEAATDAEAVAAIFARFDSKGTGLVSKDSLARVLKAVVVQFSEAEVQVVLGQVFPPQAKEIPYSRFVDYVFARQGASAEGGGFPGLPGAEEADLGAIFACIDVDGNGSLDKEEVLRAACSPSEALAEFCRQVPTLQPFLDVGSWEASFLTMDTNQDGMISWFEFVRFFSSSRPEHFLSGRPDVRAAEDLLAVFACLDVNRNGFLEKEELLAAIRRDDPALTELCAQVPTLQALLRTEDWEAAFRKFDTNQDGKISWHEFFTFFNQLASSK